MVISFEGDVPFPETNWLAYREIYIAEQQLRRIAMGALMARHGSELTSVLPTEVTASAKRNLAQIKQRAYLGGDDAAEVLWATTLNELLVVLTAETSRKTVGQLTGFTSQLLESKLDEIRVIRNIIGHSRAASYKTLTILQAALASLERGFDQFRTIVFQQQYSTFDRAIDGEQQVPLPVDHPLRPVLDQWLSETPLPFPPNALRLGENEWFNYLALIPEEFRLEPVSESEKDVGRWADLETLLDRCKASLPLLLAFTVNRSGHTVSVVWSKACTATEQQRVIQDFVGCVGRIWDGVEYPAQTEQVVCHPKVWFHSAW